ncbi:MAG: DNA translocase FtsK, partial [Angelakisella sp.]
PAPRKKLNDPMEIFGEPAKSEKPEKPEKPSDELTIDEIISRAVGPLTAQTTPPAKTDEVLKPLVETPSGMFCFDAPAEPPKAEPPKVEAQGKEPAKEPPQPAPEVPAILKPLYSFPPVSLLKESKQLPKGDTSKELKANADRLVDTLKSFGVQTRIVDISRGPAVTRYELQPSAGVKISRITNLADDIALNLAAAGVRIEAPIPNKAAIGIEVPNKIISTVPIRELLDSQLFRDAKSKLTVVLGRDITGELALADLGKMPHLLIAGATGSGKSVCINSLIVSLLFKANPDEVKLLMIDPKVVELGSYNGIPHLLSPVVTDPKKAAGALCTMVGEMLRRYKLFADHNVRDLSGYNKLAQDKQEFEPLPQIVIIIDELADLMMASPKDVEDYICRLAQMARAAGMHLVIATQRPSVDVITGVIKANIPSRISFAVSSQIDSRTILDMGGAEKLLGRGDMLYYPVGSPKPTRIQGCFVTDGEVEHVVEYIKNGSAADYDQTMMDEIDRNAAQVGGKGAGKNNAASGGGEDDTDALFTDAIQAVVEAGQASTSLLQRRLKVGYARAARLIDEMEQRGIVGPFEGSKPRQVLISKERFYEMKMTQSE